MAIFVYIRVYGYATNPQGLICHKTQPNLTANKSCMFKQDLALNNHEELICY